tara:strand:+ start:89 stop:673 length:585 start_codon:yes stop_codon:yes gene_type:complete
MPILPTLVPALNASFTANGLKGVTASNLASSISTAVSNWANIPTNINLVGVTTGCAGAGSVNGVLTLPPNPSFYISAFSGMTIVGLDQPRLCNALSDGISKAFSSAVYTGASAGVGIGADVSSVIGVNRGSLYSLLQSTLAGFTVKGVSSDELCRAITVGVSNHLSICTGKGAVVGSPSPVVGVVGTSTCQVVI